MKKPKDDPKLWTLEGIEAALDEACGEMGIQVTYGWVRIGQVYQRHRARTLDTQSDIPDVRQRPGVVELWATITVDENDLRQFLIADAADHLKPGQRFEIRRKVPQNMGRTHGMAWYRNDAMDKRETWGRVPIKPEHAPQGGYYLVGEYTTPSA